MVSDEARNAFKKTYTTVKYNVQTADLCSLFEREHRFYSQCILRYHGCLKSCHIVTKQLKIRLVLID